MKSELKATINGRVRVLAVVFGDQLDHRATLLRELDPREDAEGAACPLTTFYWDFLIRNQDRFRANRRMAMILKNVDRMSGAEVVEIEERAERLREEYGIGPLEPRTPKKRVKG